MFVLYEKRGWNIYLEIKLNVLFYTLVNFITKS